MARTSRIGHLTAFILGLPLLVLGACGGEIEASGPGVVVSSHAPAALEFPPLGRPSSEGADESSAGPASVPARGVIERPRPEVKQGRAVQAREGSLARPVAAIVADARQRALEASKGRCRASQTKVAVECVDLATGARLVSLDADRPLIPASNLKVVTAGAALLGLGIDAEFETIFEAIGRIEGGRLLGDLVVRAGADPMHQREGDGGLSRWFDALESDLRAAGIQAISGDVILDHGPFSALGTGPEWPDEAQHWQQYCGLASGFTANGGAYRVSVSSDSRAARVVLRPREHEEHRLERRGSVDVGGKKNDLRVGANEGGVTVAGRIPANFGPFVKEFRHPDPDRLFASTLRRGLEDRGIRVRSVLLPREESANRASRGVAVHVMRSPVRSILEAILGDSNNPVTDQLFTLLGGRLRGDGSREGSAAAIRDVLVENQIDVTGLVQVEGSGLSRANRLTARTLCGVHAAVAARPELASVYADALLLSGVDKKLKRRMVGTPAEGRVVAKTGWISGASSLSGLILDVDGTPLLAFAILVSYPRVSGLNTKAWKPMQDELCALFAGDLARRSSR